MTAAPAPLPSSPASSPKRLTLSRGLALGLTLSIGLLAAGDAGRRFAEASRTPNLFSLNADAEEADGDAAGEFAPGVVLVQDNDSNLARILSFGPVQAIVSQFGLNNEAQVRQAGTGLVSVVEQGRQLGTPSAFEAELARAPASVNPFGVAGARAFVDQVGVNNRSSIGQFAPGAFASVVQAGSDNVSSIFQAGRDAIAFVSQTGTRSGSIIQQHDFAVRAGIVQVGDDTRSEVRQWDRSSFSEARVFQAGSRAMSDIDQAGVSNLAMVVQWDQGEHSSSSVVQDGNRGHARIDQAGVEMVSIVRQTDGEDHVAQVYQAGVDNISEITQAGVAQVAMLRQEGDGNRSVITQSGARNTATVVQ